MKKVIREGVFETNSSSSHSVVLKKKENDNVDEDASYEIRTPLAKTMFLIGLYTSIKEDSHYGEDGEDDEYAHYEIESEGVLIKFIKIIIEEYIAMSNITEEEFKKQYHESKFTYQGRCHCSNFFEEGALIDCDCSFHTFSNVTFALKLPDDATDSFYHEKAKELLSDEYKFVLKEFYCGVYQVGDGEIY